MGDLYRAIPIDEETPVEFVGVYVLRWGKGRYPTHGFIPVEIPEPADNEALGAWHDRYLRWYIENVRPDLAPLEKREADDG